jgi:glycerol-3-phosphate dehydrogenase
LKRAVGESTVTRAEVVHAARREMAVTLQDVVLRRTELGTACPPSEAELRTTAELLAGELGWDDGRTADEIEAMREFFREHGASRNYGDTDSSPLPAG